MRGRIEQRFTNFSGGVRVVDASLGTASKTSPSPGSAIGPKGKREELLYALNMIYDRRTGLARRRNPHTGVDVLPVVKMTSMMPGSFYPAGSAKQLLLSNGANIYQYTGGVPSSVLSGLTADSLWHGVSAPQSGGQGPMWMMNGVEARYWTGAAGGAWTAATGTLPIGKYLAYHGIRVWAAGMTALAGVSDPRSAVAWSEQGDPRNWPSANVTMFDPNDGDEITGIGRIGPYLLVFKRRKTWLVYDLDTSANRQLSASVGCISHRSIVETLRGTFFMTERGPALCDGSEIKLIEDKLNLTSLIDLTDTQANLTRQVHAAALNDDVYLNIGQYKSSPPSHDEYPLNQYDLINDAWWQHTRPQAAMCTWNQAGTNEVWGIDHGGNPNATARTLIRLFTPLVGSQYATDWSGEELACSFHIRDADFNSDARKRIRSIVVEANAYFNSQFMGDDVAYPTARAYDLTSLDGVQRAVIPRPSALPPVRRIGFVLSGGDYVTNVSPGPFEIAAITIHADFTAR